MKKIRFIVLFFILLFPCTAVAKISDTGKCITESDYVFSDDSFIEYVVYTDITKEIYNSYATTSDSYSYIACQDFMAITTPGVVGQTLSGIGINYSPINAIITRVCRGEFDNNAFVAAYKNASSATKAAMDEELNLYIDWTDNFKEKIKDINLEVTIDDVDNNIYKAVNYQTELKNKTDVVLSNLSKTGKDSLSTTINGKTVSYLWLKGVTFNYEYVPISKQTIMYGSDYGRVVLASDKCTNCTNPNNMLYTDFSMPYGNHMLKISANYINKDWTIVSSCGYNIYNSGSKTWYERFGYRQISLSNPFLDREVPSNWQNWQEKKLITGSEYNKDPLYIINLDRDSIRSIKSYNKSKGYQVFYSVDNITIDEDNKIIPYKSEFIHNAYANIFTKAGDEE